MGARRFFSMAAIFTLLVAGFPFPSFPNPSVSRHVSSRSAAEIQHPLSALSRVFETEPVLNSARPAGQRSASPSLYEGGTIQLQSMDISGPREGVANHTFAFTATVAPTTAVQPITYVWQVTDRAFDVDLENDDGGLQPGGVSSSWEWGEPTSGPGSAHSGSSVWATNLDGNANYNENSYLTSPIVDLSDFTNESLVLSWWEWLQPYSWGDTYYGELLVRGASAGWTKLYHGSASNNPTWTNQQVDITGFGGASDFQFRFHLLGNSSYPGWYVDDIAIKPGSGGDGAQPPITHTTGISDTASFLWQNPGTRVIRVTASNAVGALSDTHAIKILGPMSGVVIDGPTVGVPGVDQTFSAQASPITATWPVTFVWQVSGNPSLGGSTSLITTTDGLNDAVTFNWDDIGTQTITLTAVNAVSTVQGVYEVEIANPTRVDGSISSNTTWRTSNSPYLVTENIMVFEGATLTIEPGVTIWFEDTFGLQVMGTLVARGTSDQPIVFSSPKGQKDKNDWWGIAFKDTATDAAFDAEGSYVSGSALQFVTVEYAGYRQDTYVDYYAVSAPDTALFVDHSAIRHNGCGGLQVGGNGSYATSNAIWDNAGIGILVESDSNATRITNNTVEDNHDSGIYIDSASGGNPVTIVGNSISGNTAAINGGGIYARGVAISINGNAISDNAAYAGGGIYASGLVTISGNMIRQNTANAIYERNGGGGIYARAEFSGSISVDNNLIENNSTKGTGGGIFSSGNNDVSHNLILGNTAKSGLAGGVYSQDVNVAQEQPVLQHNTFEGNSDYALYNNNDFQDATRLDARYNWWGTDDEQLIKGAIYDFRDYIVKGLVVYTPYLFERPSLEPSTGTLSGRSTGQVDVSYSFEASVFPLAAVAPITYVWQAEDQTPFTRAADSLYDQASFAWDTTGSKIITVTASNEEGGAVISHTINIAASAESDDYEADGTCAQATSIATSGATQLHSFHVDEDEDWVSFEATAGGTYVVEATTPEDSDADVSVEVYDDCGGGEIEEQRNSFSPDISLTFQAAQDGKLYMRLTHTGSLPDAQGATYFVSVRALSETPTQGALILVTGKMMEDDPLQPNLYGVTDAVYRLFLTNGYTGARIYYLAPDAYRDIDQDGVNDVDAVSNRANLEYAITGWAKETLTGDQALTLYMMDHGGYDVFYLNYTEHETSLDVQTITPLDLSNWLDELEAASSGRRRAGQGATEAGMKINVVIEACHSGSFINEAPQKISKPGRVVVASTGAYPAAHASTTGAVFSDAFVAALGRGMSLYASFAEARRATQEAYPSQTPWLDDDGDGIPNEIEDGQVAAQRGFAYAGTFGPGGIDWPPYISWATINQLERTIEAEIWIQEGKAVASAQAWIYPPSYQPPPAGEDMVVEDVEKVPLIDLDGDGVLTADYDFFREMGPYRVVIYATDVDGLSARPKEASLSGPDFSGFTHRTYLPLIIK